MGSQRWTSLARDIHICKLIIEIDAKSIVDLLKLVNDGIIDSHLYSALINLDP